MEVSKERKKDSDLRFGFLVHLPILSLETEQPDNMADVYDGLPSFHLPYLVK